MWTPFNFTKTDVPDIEANFKKEKLNKGRTYKEYLEEAKQKEEMYKHIPVYDDKKIRNVKD